MRRLLLIAWLPFIVFLFPLPPQAAKSLVNEIGGEPEGALQPSHIKNAPQQKSAQPSAPETSVEAFERALWLRWFEDIALLFLGLSVGLAAWREWRYWQRWALAMSVCYLILVAVRYMHGNAAVPASWLYFETSNSVVKLVQVNARLVESAFANGSVFRGTRVFCREFLMPVFQGIVLWWTISLFLRKKRTSQ